MTPAELDQLADRLAERLLPRLVAAETADPVGDVHDAAQWLGCSVPTVERRSRSGCIPSMKIGRLRRYRRSDVLAAGRDGGRVNE